MVVTREGTARKCEVDLRSCLVSRGGMTRITIHWTRLKLPRLPDFDMGPNRALAEPRIQISIIRIERMHSRRTGERLQSVDAQYPVDRSGVTKVRLYEIYLLVTRCLPVHPSCTRSPVSANKIVGRRIPSHNLKLVISAPIPSTTCVGCLFYYEPSDHFLFGIAIVPAPIILSTVGGN